MSKYETSAFVLCALRVRFPPRRSLRMPERGRPVRPDPEAESSRQVRQVREGFHAAKNAKNATAVEHALSVRRIVYVAGARQCGKTTLLWFLDGTVLGGRHTAGKGGEVATAGEVRGKR